MAMRMAVVVALVWLGVVAETRASPTPPMDSATGAFVDAPPRKNCAALCHVAVWECYRDCFALGGGLATVRCHKDCRSILRACRGAPEEPTCLPPPTR